MFSVTTTDNRSPAEPVDFPDDPGSRVGVAADLMMSLAARRVAAVRAVCGLLGPTSLDKLWSLFDSVDDHAHRMRRGSPNDNCPRDQSHLGRELLVNVARLEEAAWNLLAAQWKTEVAA